MIYSFFKLYVHTQMVKSVESHDFWTQVQFLTDQPTGTRVTFPFIDRTVGVRYRQVKQRQVAGTQSRLSAAVWY